jgi:hypothetical protein
MMCRFAICFLLIPLTGCGGVRYEHDPVSYSPLADMRWESPLADRSRRTAEPDSKLRRRAVSFALERLTDPSEKSGFGKDDVSDLFAALKVRVDWSKDKPLSTLIRAAQRRDAFDTRKMPLPGDIVLFHNQADQNQNRVTDDWLTGCGIVTEVTGKTFAVMARSGRGPRLIYATPDTPSVRTKNGTVINSFLRVPTPADPLDTEYLAGLLFAGRIDLEKLVSK